MINNTNIIYKDIPGYEGLYKVSNFGDVISCSRLVYTGRGSKRRLISQKEKKLNTSDRKGYKVVNLRKDGKTRTLGVHRLVLWAFVGKQEVGIEVRHLNSNPSDNRLVNLAYGTKSDNMQDAVKLGTLVFSLSKLTRDDVKQIAQSKERICDIGRRFHTSTTTICNIKAGKSFKGFTGDIYYTPRKTKRLTDEVINKIRDRNYSRKELMQEFNLTIHQIKRIRKGTNNISIG